MRMSNLARADLRAQRPELKEAELNRELVRMFYGR